MLTLLYCTPWIISILLVNQYKYLVQPGGCLAINSNKFDKLLAHVFAIVIVLIYSDFGKHPANKFNNL